MNPVARYQINAEIYEKGVGYNLKNAVEKLKIHNISYSIQDFNATSSNVKFIVEILPSGDHDKHVQLLQELFENSTQLPHDKSKKPTISITPLEADADLIQHMTNGPIRTISGWLNPMRIESRS